MTSQFTIYSASDPAAPQLNGLSGSLIDVLNGCLYTGYGTKTPLKWLKPIPDDPVYDVACWQQPSGSGLILHINDTGPFSSSVAWTQEAWATGYESILGLTGSFPNGTGFGQFPYPGQTGLSNFPSSTSGSVIWRKSDIRSNASRHWILFGDAYGFYLFVAHNQTQYSLYTFGDIFSFKPGRDAYKCVLSGRIQSSNANSITIDQSDYVFQPDFGTYPMYAARSSGGGGRSIRMVKNGDAGKCSMASGVQYVLMAGLIPAPNAVDGAIYMSPLWACEVDSSSLRGRFRGLWFPTHLVSNFGDGQTFSGTGELSGKTFMIISPGVNSGHFAVEISNTVETNDN
jgi:hypothetical protein